MTAEKKIETIESDLRLLKGEVKESLVEVRDFLLNFKIPVPLKYLDAGSDNKMSVKVNMGMNHAGAARPDERSEQSSETRREPQQESQGEPPVTQAGRIRETQPAPPKDDDGDTPQPVVQIIHPEKAPQDMAGDGRKNTNIKEEVNQSRSQVNLIANLIRWVSIARREIGEESLSVFLDVYSVAAGLSDELRAVILKLSEVSGQPAGDGNTADAWSRLLLELHGILVESAPLPAARRDSLHKTVEAAKAAKRAGPGDSAPSQDVRLKPVVPVNGDKEQEFDPH